MAAYFISSTTKFSEDVLAVAGYWVPSYPPSPIILTQGADRYIQFWDVRTPSADPYDDAGAIGTLIWHMDYKSMGFETRADAVAAGADLDLVTSMVKFHDFMILGFQGAQVPGATPPIAPSEGFIAVWKIDPASKTAAPISKMSVPLRAPEPNDKTNGWHGIQSIAINYPYMMVYTGGWRQDMRFIAGPGYTQELRVYRISYNPDTPDVAPTFKLMKQADHINGPLRDFTEVPFPPQPYPWSNLTDRYTAVSGASTLEAFPGTPEWDVPNHIEI